MVFITGDTHNNIDIEALITFSNTKGNQLTKEDVLLIAGDFGVPWKYNESNTDKALLDWYDKQNFTTMFIDGNHENFDALNNYPQAEYKNAKCHQLRDTVFHIQRGEVLKIDNHKIWCFGGAKSLDKANRIEGVSWWREEMPTYRECEYGLGTLLKEKPDIILTHDCPLSIIRKLYYNNSKSDPMEVYLEEILYNIKKMSNDFKWYFGHHHKDRVLDKHFVAVYNEVLSVD